jgi:hypothetical protein
MHTKLEQEAQLIIYIIIQIRSKRSLLERITPTEQGATKVANTLNSPKTDDLGILIAHIYDG